MKKFLILAECAICAMTNGKVMMPALADEWKRRRLEWAEHARMIQAELDAERRMDKILTGRANA